MPFTLAHPAAALPLARGPLSRAGLAVGSVAPDFEYFLRWAPHSVYSNSVSGVLLVCLPMGLFVLWVVDRVWREAPLALLPRAHAERLHTKLDVSPFVSWRRTISCTASIVLGAFTHLGLDAVTHSHGAVAMHVGFLHATVWEGWLGKVPVYELMQYVLSVVGMVLLAVWYGRWYRSAPIQPLPAEIVRLTASRRFAAVAIMAAVATAVALVYAHRFVVGWPGLPSSVLWTDPRALRLFAVVTVVVFLSMCAVEVTLFSLGWRWRLRALGQTRPTS